LRRAATPVMVAVVVAVMASAALGAVVGLVVAVVDRRRRLLRVSGFALTYGAVELAVMAAAGFVWVAQLREPAARRPAWWVATNTRLLAWGLGAVLTAARRCFGFEVDVVDVPVAAGLAGSAPLLVLARHGGPGDSFALVHLLVGTYAKRVRIVLKEVLQLDPMLDIILNRLGACFLPPSGAADAAALVGGVAAALGPGEALLLFPEGGNWTPTRRRRAIHRLRRNDHHEAARVAALMTHVLPPRPAGVLECLEARPDLGVVMVAHAGLDRLSSLGAAWAAVPVTRPMTVRLWDAVPPPAGDAERLAWLTTEWATVDEWIDAHHARAE